MTAPWNAVYLLYNMRSYFELISDIRGYVVRMKENKKKREKRKKKNGFKSKCLFWNVCWCKVLLLVLKTFRYIFFSTLAYFFFLSFSLALFLGFYFCLHIDIFCHPKRLKFIFSRLVFFFFIHLALFRLGLFMPSCFIGKLALIWHIIPWLWHTLVTFI